MIERLAYSIIYVADLAGMTRFYRDVLGLPVGEEGPRFVAFGGAGVPLALEAGGPVPAGPRARDRNPTLIQFAVADIEAGVAALAALAFFRDPEGNRLALLSAEGGKEAE